MAARARRTSGGQGNVRRALPPRAGGRCRSGRWGRLGERLRHREHPDTAPGARARHQARRGGDLDSSPDGDGATVLAPASAHRPARPGLVRRRQRRRRAHRSVAARLLQEPGAGGRARRAARLRGPDAADRHRGADAVSGAMGLVRGRGVGRLRRVGRQPGRDSLGGPPGLRPAEGSNQRSRRRRLHPAARRRGVSLRASRSSCSPTPWASAALPGSGSRPRRSWLPSSARARSGAACSC